MFYWLGNAQLMKSSTFNRRSTKRATKSWKLATSAKNEKKKIIEFFRLFHERTKNDKTFNISTNSMASNYLNFNIKKSIQFYSWLSFEIVLLNKHLSNDNLLTKLEPEMWKIRWVLKLFTKFFQIILHSKFNFLMNRSKINLVFRNEVDRQLSNRLGSLEIIRSVKLTYLTYLCMLHWAFYRIVTTLPPSLPPIQCSLIILNRFDQKGEKRNILRPAIKM